MRTSKLIATLAAAAILTPASAASAATPAVKFTGWQADYAGTKTADTPTTNAKLNGEWITLTNTTSRAITIGGYRVSDNGGIHTYVIPAKFSLGAKKSVRLHTGIGRNTSTDLYWGQTVSGRKPARLNAFIWNNSADTATLKSNTGQTLHTCVYKRTASGYKAC